MSANTSAGAAAVTLSMRSSMPPCPGNTLPLSLRPTARLSMLSVRSPTMDTAATATQVSTNGHDFDGKQVAAPRTTPPARWRAMPPNTPSQVFFGDTRGASGTRPNHRPAKNAPVSAAHTSASVNSTQCVLCVAKVT